MKRRIDSTTNVTSIVLAALAFGLVAGFPLGYIARQVYGQTASSNMPQTASSNLSYQQDVSIR